MNVLKRTNICSMLSCNVMCGSFTDPLPIHRFKTQAIKIQKLRPEVVCLQEFNNRYVERVYRHELEREYHFIVERVSLQEISRRLMLCMSFMGTSYVIHPFLTIVCVLAILNPYVHNFMVGSQKTGNAILVRRDHPVGVSHVSEFGLQSGDMLNWMRRRGYIETIFRGVVIRNTHLNHGVDEHKTCEYRSLQMSECVENLPSPALLVGDFNTENIESICRKGFSDVAAPLGCTFRTDNPLTHTIPKDKRIDYIFAKGVEVLDTNKIDFDSDHDGLYVRFLAHD